MAIQQGILDRPIPALTPLSLPPRPPNRRAMMVLAAAFPVEIVYILGGPGVGKGTACAELARRYQQLHHISVGDILRAEEKDPESEYAELIQRNLREGRLGPMEMTVKLLGREIDRLLEKLGEERKEIVCLIDGFPRSMDRLRLFEETVFPALGAVFLQCSDEVMLARLAKRGDSGERSDDNDESNRKRLETFHGTSKRVIEHLAGRGTLWTIDAEKGFEDVYSEVERVLKHNMGDRMDRSGKE